MGASNVFLVTGENIADAVSSTYWSFHLGICDEPAGPDIGGKQKSHKHWLVAYLGIGQGTPPQWLFQAATIQRQTLEVRYTKPQYAKAGADKIGFFYWVPLPQLKAGTYEVKLIDADKDRVMLTRWVSVR